MWALLRMCLFISLSLFLFLYIYLEYSFPFSLSISLFPLLWSVGVLGKIFNLSLGKRKHNDCEGTNTGNSSVGGRISVDCSEDLSSSKEEGMKEPEVESEMEIRECRQHAQHGTAEPASIGGGERSTVDRRHSNNHAQQEPWPEEDFTRLAPVLGRAMASLIDKVMLSQLNSTKKLSSEEMTEILRITCTNALCSVIGPEGGRKFAAELTTAFGEMCLIYSGLWQQQTNPLIANASAAENIVEAQGSPSTWQAPIGAMPAVFPTDAPRPTSEAFSRLGIGRPSSSHVNVPKRNCHNATNKDCQKDISEEPSGLLQNLKSTIDDGDAEQECNGWEGQINGQFFTGDEFIQGHEELGRSTSARGQVAMERSDLVTWKGEGEGNDCIRKEEIIDWHPYNQSLVTREPLSAVSYQYYQNQGMSASEYKCAKLEVQMRTFELQKYQYQMSLRQQKMFEEDCARKAEKSVFERNKFEKKEEEVQRRRSIEEMASFRLERTDEIFVGLLILFGASCAAIVYFGLERWQEKLHFCRQSQAVSDRSWWYWKAFDPLRNLLRMGICHLELFLGFGFAVVLMLFFSYLLMRSNGADFERRPVFFMFLLLGGMGGFLGCSAVDYGGGNGYIWLFGWLTLCTMQAFGLKRLYPMLHGHPPEVILSSTGEVSCKPSPNVRRFLFRLFVMLVLPVVTSVLPFYSPYKVLRKLSQLVA